ncbi:MAG TPA: TIR domain-containing protein, partial [Gemmataceae bacterium]|nr:TIR domain-containing protein [Gemmataceae bacterium]
MSTSSPSTATSTPCQVFISYASKDADRVVPIAQALERAGLSVWRDGDRILGGQYYGEQIVHALAHSRVVLLVCSPESLASDNVHREVLLTWDYYHRRYVPVWIAPPGEIPERFRYCLAGCQYIDAHAEPAERWLAQLLSALRALGVIAAGERETAPPPLSTGRGSGAGGQGPHFKPGDRPIAGADWELVSLLGKGGFGEVWKAHNPDLPSQPPVALKFCLRLDERGRQLLRHEADMVLRVQQQVRHDGVVPLLHAYLNSEPPCLEYPYVEG